MIKFMFVARRAAGTTRKGALDHLRDIHAKMVVCPPADAGPMPLDYVQNHVIDGAYPGTGAHALERDLVTELWFESVEHLRAATITPYYLENLRPDEPRFVDDATVARMMVRTRTLIEGQGGLFKVFVFMSRSVADDAVWTASHAAVATGFMRCVGLVAAIENTVMAPPTGESPFVDLVLEGWFADAAAALAALREASYRIAAPGVDGIATERSFAVVAEQYDTMRLRALHGCATAP